MIIPSIIKPKIARGTCTKGPTKLPKPRALAVPSGTRYLSTSTDLSKASRKSTQPINNTAKKHPLKKYTLKS